MSSYLSQKEAWGRTSPGFVGIKTVLLSPTSLFHEEYCCIEQSFHDRTIVEANDWRRCYEFSELFGFEAEPQRAATRNRRHDICPALPGWPLSSHSMGWKALFPWPLGVPECHYHFL